MLCGPDGAAAARLLPGVDRRADAGRPLGARRPAAGRARATSTGSWRRLADWRFDEAVVLTSFHQSPLPTALLLRLAGVARITGASVDYAGRPARRPPAPRRGPRPRTSPSPSACSPSRPPPGYPLPPTTTAASPSARRRRSRGARAATAPTSSCTRAPPCPARAWPAEHARRGPSRCWPTRGWRVVVTGGPRRAAPHRRGRRARGHRPRRPHRPRAAVGGAGRRGGGRRRQHRRGAPGRRGRHAGRLAVRAGRPGRALGARTACRTSCSATRSAPLPRLARPRVPGARPPLPRVVTPETVVDAVARPGGRRRTEVPA